MIKKSPIRRKAETESRDSYENFLIQEYTNLSNAHYNTDKTIATFFQYYLLIVSLPFTVVAAAFRFIPAPGQPATAGATQMPDYSKVVMAGSFLIAALGLVVMNYVLNLRFDALLYARAVNAIRRYFSELSGLDLGQRLRTRLLPETTHRPKFWEPRFFLWVVFAFALLDAAYGSLGVYWAYQLNWYWPSIAVPGGIFVVHVLSYAWLAHHREYRYLKSYIIGLDVDGVLNTHRAQFCSVLNAQCGKDVDPDAITAIPVRYVKGLGVTEADEQAVFNHPSYWSTMPVMEGAADVLRRLRNTFGYKVFVFTHRDWPQRKGFPTDRKKEYAAMWPRHVVRLWRRRSWQIRHLTKRWLKQQEIRYDKLIIEKGNVYTSGRNLLTRNRFVIAARKQIRLFVEDDLYKAKKLAEICDMVFLIDHPYNQTKDGELSRNVVRVKSWQEIHDFIREHL